MLVLCDALEMVARDLLRRELPGAHRRGDAPGRPGVERIHLPRHDTERMRLSSVNLASEAIKLRSGARTIRSGIGKRPTAGAVEVGTLGLAGDLIASKQHHGGPDQAVYVYGEGDYAWWEEQLGRRLEPATFGENLTVSELETGGALVGDRLHVGAAVVLEVTSGRIPCNTLRARMGIRGFTRMFHEAGRPGLYCRVLAAGSVQAGDDVRYEQTAGPTIGVLEFIDLFYEKAPTLAQIERALAAPICERGRRGQERQLAALRSP
jgi:MOSC domain-containing protein YiiM